MRLDYLRCCHGVNVEIWLDDLTNENGKLIITIPVAATGGETNFKTFTKALRNVSGHQVVFVKFPKGAERALFIKSSIYY